MRWAATWVDLLMLTSVAAVVPAGASVLRVPSEYATINAGLDVAVAGDTVLVAPGTYDQFETRLLGDGYWFSSVAFLRSDVALVSEHGASVTTLRMDGAVAPPVVLRAYGETGTAYVEGFTVTGTVAGLAGLSFTWGGRCSIRDCVFMDIGNGGSSQIAVGGTGSDLEVYNCRFENIHGSVGSAIHQTSGTLILEDSEFVNCTSGAMKLQYDSGFPHATGATIRRCRFVDNVQTNGGGGALTVNSYTSVLIEDCWFESNRATGGGAVSLAGATSVKMIRNSTFVGNWAGTYVGGAIYARSPVTVEGNTFYGNSALYDYPTGSDGSAVFLPGTGSRVFRRNVVVNSTGDQAVGTETGTIETGCNVYWNNALGNTSGFAPSPTDLQADPMFCNPSAKDFTVNAISPCLPGFGHPSCTEQVGAWGPGCGAVGVEATSWGKVKSDFRGQSEVTR
jgi:hypothetical protein